MNKGRSVRAWAIPSVALLGLSVGAFLLLVNPALGDDKVAGKIAQVGLMGPAPKAQCSPGDWTESGLQGQTTKWERESGDSEGGYNCNLELVGQFQGEGAYSQKGPAFFDHCAYMANQNNPLQEHAGVVVIDVSDPANPRPTAYLDDTPAGLDPHENLKVHSGRKLLGLAQFMGPNFAVYDLSVDCAHPTLMSSITVPGSQGHMGGWAADGKTYYIGQQYRGPGGTMAVVDVTDPYNAKHLLTSTFSGDGRPHDIYTNADGTRIYTMQIGLFAAPPTDTSAGPNGLVILDVSDIQLRKPDPQIRIVGKLFWEDQGQAEQALPIAYNGHPYIISTDESGGQRSPTGLAGACARGASPYGYSNVIDIADERNPRIISKIMLEVHDPANCESFLSEPPDTGGGNLDYSIERCAPDRPQNPTMLACGTMVGTRVFDIRDPYRPAEIAYWKGPAVRKAFLPASGSWSPTADRTVDKQAGLPSFHKVPAADGKGRELQLWIVGDGNGFQVLRFSNSAKARHKELFAKALQTSSSEE